MPKLIRYFLLLIISAVGLSVVAQESGLRGYIRDTAGEPLPFASIYVKETGTGAVSNTDGRYELRIKPGNYTLIFQFLGYDTKSERLEISSGFREFNVTLEAEALELNTVDIYEGAEDPAYTVMRKAIAKADFHRQQVDYYKAQVYIKGSGRLLKSPFFARKALAKEGIDSTVAFTSESVSIIEYERPSTFRERVISVYTQGNDNSVNANSYINGSFYEPTIAESISPLSPRAFAYYKFKLEGFFQDRNYSVNKIRVTPRSRGDDVFEGFIYIVEDQWSIHSLDLSTYKVGIKFDVAQIYAPVEEAVWLPVNATFDITGSILGFAFEYRYLANLGDYDVKVNPDLTYDFAVIDEKVEREKAKEVKANNKKIAADNAEDKLAGGEELTRKELRQLMREYEKEDEADRRAEEDGPPVVSNYEYSVDSLATQRDSVYWSKIRPVTLTAVEQKGYAVRDSMAQAAKVKEEEGNDDRRNRKRSGPFGPLDILTGSDYRLAKGKYLFYESPIYDVQFNPAEGYNATGSVGYRAAGDHPFRLQFDGHYGFARSVMNYRAFAQWQLNKPERRDSIHLEGGNYIAQYNERKPVSEFINTFYALFFERNYVQVLEKEYLHFAYGKKWDQTARVSLSAEYAQREHLFNQTDHTLFDREERSYDPNFPAFAELAGTEVPLTNTAFVLDLNVEVRPWQKYVMRNNKRRARSNGGPTIALNYRKGIPKVGESTSDFDQLDVTFKHSFRTGVRGRIHFKANAGTFLNNDQVAPSDFKHFPGNRMVFTASDPVGSFRLLPYYRHSTRQEYLALSTHYQFRKFLFTRIWEVQLLGIKENVFVNYLATPTSQDYVEVGYSIDNILRFFRVELVTAFQNGQYYDFGVRVGIASSLFGGMVSVN